MIIWICGQSGAGKTTIGQSLFRHIKPEMPNLFMLDGDDFRWAMDNDLGYTQDARRKNSHRIARICHLLDSQGINVICCAITIHPEVQEYNRSTFQEYFEVLIEASSKTLHARDTKGIYKRALAGEISGVVGVDIEFVPPVAPHLVLNNDQDLDSFDGFVNQIVATANGLISGSYILPKVT